MNGMTEVQCLLYESGQPTDQGTVVLSCMLENGTVVDSGLTKQEEVVITRINLLHDSLDKLENWAYSKEGPLDSLLEIPNTQLLQWQGVAKIIRLKQQNFSGTLTKNNQDAIYLTN